MKNRTVPIFLVGAGPGDPGLLTLKGAEALRRAEAVVYDWLVNPAILGLAPAAEKIFVGKRGGIHSKEQAKINQILLKLARQGKRVVRLKGGDPFIFGRGGEEAGFLARHRIPYEVVPGITAGIGVPAYAGIPLTDRRFASQVVFVTGHEDPAKGQSRVDWKSLGKIRGTLVSFMPVKNLSRIVRALWKGGKPPKTPVALIEWGTFPNQRVVEGTLENIVQKIRESKIESPALAVIGEVVRLRKKLAWFEKKPLWGKTVLVTRAQTQAGKLVQKLGEQGARVIEFPTIEILPPLHPQKIDQEILKISVYDWVIFTSANGVEFFFGRMKRLSKDARIFSGIKVGAIGEATAGALQEKGIQADLVPKEFTTLGLFQSLKKAGEVRGRKFLLARADIAPPDLKKNLEKAGASLVVELPTYRTRQAVKSKKELMDRFLKERIDFVTFTSASTVQNFFDPLPVPLRKKIRARLVSIGPVTTQTLKRYGFKPAREAKVHTLEGLIAAIANGGSR